MDFPLLITGERVQSSAIRQLPAQHIEHFFEGYHRQAHLRSDANHTIWQLRYSKLNASEAMQLRSFFEAQPIGGQFDFTDPWTGVVYTDCRFATPRLELSCDRDNRYSAQVEIENAN